MQPSALRMRYLVNQCAAALLLWMIFAHLTLAETPNSSWTSQTLQLPAAARGEQPPVVTALAIHPSGTQLAVAGDDHVINILDLTSRRFVQHLRGHRDWIRSLAYAPDGSLASAGNDRRVLLWDGASGGRYRELSTGNFAVTTVAFNHQGTQLATVAFNDKLRVLDVASGRRIHELACPCIDMRACAWSPTDALIAAAGRNGKLRIWDASTGRSEDETLAHQQRVRDLAFSPHGVYLASGGEDRSIRILNRETGDAFSLSTGRAKVLTLAFCGPDHLASGGSDNLIRIWDLSQRAEVAQLAGHTGSIAALAYAHELLVSAGYDATVRVWSRQDSVAADQPTVGDRVSELNGPGQETLK